MARPFVWTPAKERALDLVRAGRPSQRLIAAHLGVTRRVVEGWCRRPAFRARLEALRAADQARWEAEWQAKLATERAQWEAEAVARAAETDRWLAGRAAHWKAVRQHRRRP